MIGKRVGLVIGNNYPNSDKKLRFAVEDALSMKEISFLTVATVVLPE